MEYVADEPREVIWLVDSLDVLRAFPTGVREKMGFALYMAQIGKYHHSAQQMRGFDVPIIEIRADGPGGTFRTMYTVHFKNKVYVLHAFQKKSASGIATPQADIDLIRQRLKLAQRLAKKKGT